MPHPYRWVILPADEENQKPRGSGPRENQVTSEVTRLTDQRTTRWQAEEREEVNTYTPDGQSVIDTMGREWPCNMWHDLPSPEGVSPDTTIPNIYWAVIPPGQTFILNNGVLTSAPITFTLSPA